MHINMSPNNPEIIVEENEISISSGSDMSKLSMSLDEIRSQSDLELWREHNVEVAAYLAKYLREEFFSEGSKARDLFLSSKSPLPPEILESVQLYDGIKIDEQKKDASFSIDMDGGEDDLNITMYDRNHPRVRALDSVSRNEELNTEVVHWVADYLGVPLAINYTSENAMATGIGGHAQALARTPYQLENGSWVYDIVDPMALKPTIGLSLKARNREEAFQELGKHISTNVIGNHLLENRVDFNLLEKLSGTQAYDLILNAGISRLQERDNVNCQFMSLLIQAYLWAYPGSFHDHTGGVFPGVSISDVVEKRFGEVFAVSIKQIFDVMNSVKPFES